MRFFLTDPFQRGSGGRRACGLVFVFPFKLSPKNRIGSNRQHPGGARRRREKSEAAPYLPAESPSGVTTHQSTSPGRGTSRGPHSQLAERQWGRSWGLEGDPPGAWGKSAGHRCPQGHHTPGRGRPAARWAMARPRRLRKAKELRV